MTAAPAGPQQPGEVERYAPEPFAPEWADEHVLGLLDRNRRALALVRASTGELATRVELILTGADRPAASSAQPDEARPCGCVTPLGWGSLFYMGSHHQPGCAFYHAPPTPPPSLSQQRRHTEQDCTCTDFCPESDNPCPWCSRMDIYEPCPVIGFGCGTNGTVRPGDPDHDCCTDAQLLAAAGNATGEA